jgi:hypothetical protein
MRWRHMFLVIARDIRVRQPLGSEEAGTARSV